MSREGIDACCAGFALWTLCCHAVVGAGGNLRALLLLASLVFAAAIAFVGRRWSRSRSLPAEAHLPPIETRPEAWHVRAGAAGIGLLLLALCLHRGDTAGAWWTGAVMVVIGAWTSLRAAPTAPPPPAEGRRLEIALLVLGIGCAAVTLVAHRPDADDSFYVNLAVAAADSPERPLLREDTLHGIPGLPLHLPVYRVHSIELLNGALSYLTGLPAILCFHVVTAAVAALLVPLALARLYRLLAPAAWLTHVAVLLVVLTAVGEAHRWYGNFGLVRLWQGKSVFLLLGVPLICAYGLEYALRPSRASWLRLAAAQVAAVGATSSAMWAAPALAIPALLAGVPLTVRGLRTLGLGMLCSAYPLGLAWAVRREMVATVPWARSMADQGPVPLSIAEGAGLVDEAVRQVLGERGIAVVFVAALLVGWTALPSGLARRFSVAFGLAALVLLNPYLAPQLTAYVTGPSYWRALWAVPLPIIATVCLLAPVAVGGRRGRILRGSLTAAGLVAVTVFLPAYGGLSRRNQTELGWPGLKVPSADYEAAAALNRLVPRAYVVAPTGVDVWVTTFHHHAYPVIVRHYLMSVPRAEVEERRMMRDVASRGLPPGDDGAAFGRALGSHSVKGVCLNKVAATEVMRTLLEKESFALVESLPEHEIWVRRTLIGPA